MADDLSSNPVCALHLDRPAIATCGRCGNFLCAECQVALAEGGTLCPDCAQKRPPPIPWDQRDEIGLLPALWRTWKLSTFQPDEFFSRVPVSGGMVGPLLYAFIVGTIGMFFILLFTFLVPVFFVMATTTSDMLTSGVSSLLMFLFSFLFYLAGYVAGLFAQAAVFHGALIVVGGRTRDFEATFRGLCFAQGFMGWYVVPLLGMVVSVVYAFVQQILALKHAHSTTGGKAALAVFLPGLACCGFFGLMVGLVSLLSL